MVAAITNGIKVSVRAEYEPFFSDPERFHYVFSYKISIENKSESTIQLKSRHWYIFDSIGEKYEVLGDGVVGNQPVIEPGHSHTYVSGCNFKSTIGQMQGYFVMERIMDGKSFKVAIPAFSMFIPYILN
jgi:ApaG protein